MQKTKLEILDETVQYYTEDPKRRATTKGPLGRNLCVYLAEDGRMCAFSRCMIDPSRAKDVATPCGDMVERLLGKRVRTDEVIPVGILKPEYDGYTIHFWLQIQGIHDSGEYWDDKGMTGIGKERVKTLRGQYKNDI